MEINITPLEVVLRVTDASGNVVPNLTVEADFAPGTKFNVVAGGTVEVPIKVTNGNNSEFLANDAVPRIQEGPSVLTNADADFTIVVGVTFGAFVLTARSDAKLTGVAGESRYLLDLVVEPA